MALRVADEDVAQRRMSLAQPHQLLVQRRRVQVPGGRFLGQAAQHVAQIGNHLLLGGRRLEGGAKDHVAPLFQGIAPHVDIEVGDDRH